MRTLLALAFVVITPSLAVSQNWLLEPVIPAGPIYQHSSIVVDENHIPHIASSRQSIIRLQYTSRIGGIWSNEPIDNQDYVRSNRALRLDDDGHARITVEGILATRGESGWAFTTIPRGFGNWWEANAIDPQGVTRVSYVWSVGSAGGYTGSFSYEWEQISPNLFIPTAPSCEMEYDTGGTLHIVALLNQGEFIRYWTKPQYAWVSEDIAVGTWPSMDIDPQGRVQVCYYDYTAGDLMHAVRNAPNDWTITPVDTDGDVGLYPSMVVDPQGRIHVSYYDVTHGDLKFARSVGLSQPWDVATVDETGNVGTWSSLAIDGETAHISYYDEDNQTLRYAQLTGSLTAVTPHPATPQIAVRAMPNPFNPSTTLEYVVGVNGRVTVTIFDVQGHVVDRLVDETRAPGTYTVQYRTRSASGVYLARVENGGQSASTKLILLK